MQGKMSEFGDLFYIVLLMHKAASVFRKCSFSRCIFLSILIFL